MNCIGLDYDQSVKFLELPHLLDILSYQYCCGVFFPFSKSFPCFLRGGEVGDTTERVMIFTTSCSFFLIPRPTWYKFDKFEWYKIMSLNIHYHLGMFI